MTIPEIRVHPVEGFIAIRDRPGSGRPWAKMVPGISLTDEDVAGWPIYGPACCDLHGRNRDTMTPAAILRAGDRIPVHIESRGAVTEQRLTGTVKALGNAHGPLVVVVETMDQTTRGGPDGL
jgi:hypothetical protein